MAARSGGTGRAGRRKSRGPLQNNQPRLSLVVAAESAGTALERCLTSLHRAAAGDEIILVWDGRRAAPADLYPFAVHVQTMGRRGRAAARNVGAAAATGDVLVFVDGDVEVPADALARVRTRFAEAETDALVGSCEATPGSGFPTEWRRLRERLRLSAAPPGAVLFGGAFCAIRREVFRAAGAYNESFRRGGTEEVELGFRLRARSCRTFFDPHAEVVPLLRESSDSVRREFRTRALPLLRCAARCGSLRLPPTFQGRDLLSAGAICVAVLALAVAPLAPVAGLMVSAGAFLAFLVLNAGEARQMAAVRNVGFAMRGLLRLARTQIVWSAAAAVAVRHLRRAAGHDGAAATDRHAREQAVGEPAAPPPTAWRGTAA